MEVLRNGFLIFSIHSYLHFYILVLEHLGIVPSEQFGNFELVAGLELVGNFVLELAHNFVWEPKTNVLNIKYLLLMSHSSFKLFNA